MSPTEEDPEASTLLAVIGLPAEGRGIFSSAVVRGEARPRQDDEAAAATVVLWARDGGNLLRRRRVRRGILSVWPTAVALFVGACGGARRRSEEAATSSAVAATDAAAAWRRAEPALARGVAGCPHQRSTARPSTARPLCGIATGCSAGCDGGHGDAALQAAVCCSNGRRNWRPG